MEKKMEKNKKNQEYWLENIRAIAILMVVFGHSIILYSSEWNLYSTVHDVAVLDLIKRFINLIQMPLFFSLSGYCFRYTMKKEIGIGELVKKKFFRLLVPFLSIGLLWMLPIKAALDYPGWRNHTVGKIVIQDIILGKDCGHLWYLPTLFLCFMILYLLVKGEEKVFSNRKSTAGGKEKQMHILCVFVIFLVSLAAARGYARLMPLMYLAWAAQYFLWFYFGYFLFEYKTELRTMKKPLKAVLALLTLVMTGAAIVVRSFIISTLATIVLILAFYTFVPDRRNRGMKFLSDNSFGIYLFHSPLIYITYTYLGNASPVIVVGLNFVVFGAAAAVMSHMIRKIPLKILIGG